MVRLFPLRHRGRSRLRQALLSKRGAARGDASRLRHLLHRLRRPPGRRRDFRPLRRSHRPQGDADRHAAVHGHRNLPRRVCADLRVDRHLGRGDLDRPAGAARYRRRRRMGRLRALGDGVGAHPRPARTGRVMAAIRRSLWTALVNHSGHRVQRLVGRPIPGLGLAHSLCAFDHPGRHRSVDSPRHPGNAGVPEAPGPGQDREGADPRSHQETAAGNHSLGIAAAVRAGAVLHLYRLRLLVHGRYTSHVAKLHSHRGVDGRRRLVRQHPALRSHLRPHRAPEDVPDRRRRNRPVRISLFWHGRYRDPVGGVHRHRALAHSARYPVRAAGGGPIGERIHARLYQPASSVISWRGHRRRTRRWR